MKRPTNKTLSFVSNNIQENINNGNKDNFVVCFFMANKLACFRRKQTCMPLLIGNNKDSSCFDLIDCDIYCRAHYF